MSKARDLADSYTDSEIDSDVIDAKAGRKNLIINGAMQVAQRGTSNTTTSSGYISLDRWKAYISTSSTITFSQNTVSTWTGELDSCMKNYARFDWLGTGSPSLKIMMQRIEDVYTASNKKIALSFYARTEIGDDIVVGVYQNFGSGGSAYVTAIETEVDITTEWVRYSLTFDMPSVQGKTIGSDSFIDLQFKSNNTTANSYLDITGVQLELGSQATDFEYRSYGEELALCQRYYYTTGFMKRSFATATNQYGNESVWWPVTMRSRPTCTWTIAAESGWRVSGFEFINSGSEYAGNGARIDFRSTAISSTAYTYGTITADAEL